MTFAALGLGVLVLVVGAAVLFGFLTPVAGLSATIGYLGMGISLLLSADTAKHNFACSFFDLAAVSMALTLLGPGAFSVDARLFGRREIIIPERGRYSRG
jgi:uncharacterized membrane protein YphA (DoxX/SURF4 family)